MRSGDQQVNYVPLVHEHISRLQDTTVAGRKDFYRRARLALNRQLSQVEGYERLDARFLQLELLEVAISEVEAHFKSLDPEPFSDNIIVKKDNNKLFAQNTALSAAANILKTILQIVMIPVLARLLGPNAYGIYSLALPTVIFFLLLADGGLGASMAREDEQNIAFWSTGFWLLLIVCTVMAFFVAGSGFVLAWMSGQQSLIGIMMLLSLALPLLALSVQADARLIRRGNLLYHNISDLSATFIGTAVVIVFALNGAGAWSLAAQYITTFLVRASVLNYFGWARPKMIFDISSLRGHFAASGSTLAIRVAELLGKLAENSIFSLCFGPISLGSYTFASQVARYISDSFTNPLLGAFFSHSLRSHKDEVAQLHAKLCRMLMTVLLPIQAITAVTAPLALPLILGNKWNDAIPILQVIIIPFSFLSIGWLSGQVLLINNDVQRGAIVQVISAVLRVAVMSSGFFIPQLSVVAAIGTLYVAQGIGTMLAIRKENRASATSMMADIVPSLLSAIAASFVASWVESMFSDKTLDIIVGGSLGIGAYVCLLWIFAGKNLRSDLLGISQVVGHRLGRHRNLFRRSQARTG